jgi:hypothetical protein
MQCILSRFNYSMESNRNQTRDYSCLIHAGELVTVGKPALDTTNVTRYNFSRRKGNEVLPGEFAEPLVKLMTSVNGIHGRISFLL